MDTVVLALTIVGVPLALVLGFAPLLARGRRRFKAERDDAWKAYVARTGLKHEGVTIRVEEIARPDEFPTLQFLVTFETQPAREAVLWAALPPALADLVPGTWQLLGLVLSRSVSAATADYVSELESGLELARGIMKVSSDPAAALLARIKSEDPQVTTRALRVLAELARSDLHAAACLDKALRVNLGQLNDALQVTIAELAGRDAEIERLAASGSRDALGAMLRRKHGRAALARVCDAWIVGDKGRDAEGTKRLVGALAELLTPKNAPAHDDLTGAQREAYHARLMAIVPPDAPNTEGVREALRILERVGTIADVPRLLAFAAKRKDMLFEYANDAVLAIRARVVDAEIGGLALTGAEGGELALTPGTEAAPAASDRR